LADRFQRREGQEAFMIWMDLFRLWLMRMVRGAASGAVAAEAVNGEHQLQARLVGNTSLDRWIDLWEKTNELSTKAFTVNLDRKQVILNTFFELERTAEGA
jgi:DNA polymerase III subunit delta'